MKEDGFSFKINLLWRGGSIIFPYPLCLFVRIYHIVALITVLITFIHGVRTRQPAGSRIEETPSAKRVAQPGHPEA